jgi:RsiW-degrading membrane proteinase PrsW (M82 family)
MATIWTFLESISPPKLALFAKRKLFGRAKIEVTYQTDVFYKLQLSRNICDEIKEEKIKMVIALFVIPLVIVIALIGVYLRKGKGVESKKDEIGKEKDDWKDWANTLIVISTVLLAFDASLLGDNSIKWAVLLNGVFGFVCILLVFFWFAGERYWIWTWKPLKFKEFKDKPILLLLSSILFGFQISFFWLAFVNKVISAK